MGRRHQPRMICLHYIRVFFLWKWKSESEFAQSCPTLCDPVDCSPPGSSVHGILQARVLVWVAILFSRGSSRPREQTWVSCTAGRFFTVWTTREVLLSSCFTSIYWPQFLPPGVTRNICFVVLSPLVLQITVRLVLVSTPALQIRLQSSFIFFWYTLVSRPFTTLTALCWWVSVVTRIRPDKGKNFLPSVFPFLHSSWGATQVHHQFFCAVLISLS